MFLNLNYEYFSLKLKGKQRQYWYEDEQGIPEGYRVTGINLEINSEHNIFRISLGYHI